MSRQLYIDSYRQQRLMSLDFTKVDSFVTRTWRNCTTPNIMRSDITEPNYSTKAGLCDWYSLWAGLLQKLSADFTETWCYDWPTNQKNLLTFGGDRVLNTDSRLLFHFPHHCRIRYFRRLAFLIFWLMPTSYESHISAAMRQLWLWSTTIYFAN